jgi:hypothetical protein
VITDFRYYFLHPRHAVILMKAADFQSCVDPFSFPRADWSGSPLWSSDQCELVARQLEKKTQLFFDFFDQLRPEPANRANRKFVTERKNLVYPHSGIEAQTRGDKFRMGGLQYKIERSATRSIRCD